MRVDNDGLWIGVTDDAYAPMSLERVELIFET